MSAMKAPSSRQTTPLVSRALKTVGIIMILAALLDMIILLVPFQVNPQWFINAATQIVDRGIIPMIGIALLLAGHWVDSSSGATPSGRSSWQDPRFWASLLASLLGLLFFLLIFLHPNNVRLNYQRAVGQINQEATQAESQLDSQLAVEVDRQRALVTQLTSASDEQLTEAVQGGAITEEQATQIRQFKENPDSLDPYLQQQAGQLKNRLQTEIGSRREQALQTAKVDSLKSGLRIGLSSLLLTIGYAIIGWTGIKTLGQMPSNRRSS